MKPIHLAVFIGFLIVCSPQARANLLVYEGFNGYAGDLSTATPNGNTIGLNTSTPYAGTNVFNYTVNASSLAFSANFLTNGGSVTTTTGTNTASARISLASAYTGTLYVSYLVNITSKGGGGADGALNRVADNDINSGARFQVVPDTRDTFNTVGSGYDSGIQTSGAILALNTTYLMIARFDSVGSAVALNGGSGTVYALTLDQYDNFILGGQSEFYLNGATIGSLATGVTARITDPSMAAGTYSFTSGNAVQFVSIADNVTFDELRYGTSLLDVTPGVVPEPSRFVLLGLGGAIWIVQRRRLRI